MVTFRAPDARRGKMDFPGASEEPALPRSDFPMCSKRLSSEEALQTPLRKSRSFDLTCLQVPAPGEGWPAWKTLQVHTPQTYVAMDISLTLPFSQDPIHQGGGCGQPVGPVLHRLEGRFPIATYWSSTHPGRGVRL
jgi:hypothetical protein